MKYLAMNKNLGKDFSKIFDNLDEAKKYETSAGGANQIWELADDGQVWFSMAYPNQFPHWALSRQSYCNFDELQLANEYAEYALHVNNEG